MTTKKANKLTHGTTVYWLRGDEWDFGKVYHDIAYSYIVWSDGQKTYTSDDAAMQYVLLSGTSQPQA